MRLNKNQIHRIIREEKRRLLELSGDVQEGMHVYIDAIEGEWLKMLKDESREDISQDRIDEQVGDAVEALEAGIEKVTDRITDLLRDGEFYRG